MFGLKSRTNQQRYNTYDQRLDITNATLLHLQSISLQAFGERLTTTHPSWQQRPVDEGGTSCHRLSPRTFYREQNKHILDPSSTTYYIHTYT